MDELTHASSSEHLKRVNAALALRDVPDPDAALAQLLRAAELAPSDVSVQVLLGLTFQDLGQFEAAEASFRRALELMPDFVDAQQALGVFLVQRGRHAEAITLLRPLAKEDHHNVIAGQAYATALFETGKRKEAIEALQALYDHLPENPDVAAQLGHFLLRAGRVKRALNVLRRAAKDCASVDVLCDLGAAYSLEGDHEAAHSTLKMALEITSDDDRVWRGLAYTFLQTGKPIQALEAIERSLALRPNDLRSWRYKASSLSSQGQQQEALAILAQAIELAKEMPDEESELARLLIERSFLLLRDQGSEAALIQIEHDKIEFPAAIGLLHLQKDILLAKGAYREALSVLGEAQERGVTKSQLALDYYHAYLGLGDEETAWLTLQPRATELSQDDEAIDELVEIGTRLYQGSRYHSSKVACQHAIGLRPSHPRALNNLGFLLIAEEDWKQGEELLLKALEYGFESPSVTRTNLAFLYLLQKRYDEALEYLRKAEQEASHDDASILRVACWYKGNLSQTQADLFPARFAKTLLAIRANMATVLGISGNYEQALDQAERAIESDPKDNIGYRVLGCIHLAHENDSGARQAWEQALACRKSRAEAELLESWLAAIADD